MSASPHRAHGPDRGPVHQPSSGQHVPTLTLFPEAVEAVDDAFADTPDEAAIRAALCRDRPHLEAAFDAARPRGRQAILHRLLQAIVRENVAGAGVKAALTEDGRSLPIPLPNGGLIRASVVRCFSLARYDFAGPVILDREGRITPLGGPRDLLDLFRDALVPSSDADAERRFQRFGDELDNSEANASLAFVGAGEHRDRLRQEAGLAGVRGTLAYARHRAAIDPTFSPLAFFEQWVVEGHPLHPGAKIKMGMAAADVIRFSPEWGAEPEARLVAVRKETCRVASAGGETPTDRLTREYPGLTAAAHAELVARGFRPDEFELIPSHPWQFAHTLPRLYADAIARGDVVPLDAPRIATRALMSVRSLAPVQGRGDGRSHLKTPIDVQLTGAVRTVSPNAAENGPMLSRVFEAIQHREDRFGGRFHVLAEDLGAYYRPRPGEGDPAALGRHLAVIFRENPEDHVGEDELPIVGSALIAASPLSDGPIVAELIGEFGRTAGIADPSEAAVAFLRRYAEVAAPPLLTLMSRYGVSLEGHLQNSVLVFRDGMPVRMLVRDFGGVRVLRVRLSRQGLEATFFPGSATETGDVDDLRNKMFYPFVQNHLGELIAAVVRWSDVEEQELWRPVAEICRDVYATLKADAGIAVQAAEDEAALFRPTLPLKAMATMRLLGDVTHYSFSDVPNPLADADRGP